MMTLTTFEVEAMSRHTYEVRDGAVCPTTWVGHHRVRYKRDPTLSMLLVPTYWDLMSRRERRRLARGNGRPGRRLPHSRSARALQIELLHEEAHAFVYRGQRLWVYLPEGAKLTQEIMLLLESQLTSTEVLRVSDEMWLFGQEWVRRHAQTVATAMRRVCEVRLSSSGEVVARLIPALAG